MMLCMLAMRNKGLTITEREGEVEGSRRDWKSTKWKSNELHEFEGGTGEKPKCRQMHGQNAKGTEEGNEKKLWELWKTERNCEMKGCAGN